MKQKDIQVAVIHNAAKWTGGAEAVAVWTLEALKDEYNVTLISTSKFPIKEVNQHYGSSLEPEDFNAIVVPLPLGLHRTSKFLYLKHFIFMRYLQRIATKFDLCISTYYEMNFGQKGIQYIHSPALAAAVDKSLVTSLNEKQQSIFKKFYRKILFRIFKFSVHDISRNLTLVNSEWTGKLIKHAYSIDPYIVYPPVSKDFPVNSSWEERENGFICTGRIAPIKRIDSIIRILKYVREAGWDIHLHIIGEKWQLNYGKKIEELKEENSSWIFLEGCADRKRLVNLIANHKYGIHGMRNEHFGISVAEMVKAGNIVFVPNDGGQVEIVGNNCLTYDSENEAAEKIIKVLRDENLQKQLRVHLAKKAGLFSTAQFINKIGKIVEQTLYA